MIKLENLTEKQINHLKEMANYCYTNENDFRVRISIRLVGRIQNVALNTRWDDIASVTEYREYASKLIKLWFPYMTADRVAEEVNNIRTKNTINIHRVVRDMYYLNNILN